MYVVLEHRYHHNRPFLTVRFFFICAGGGGDFLEIKKHYLTMPWSFAVELHESPRKSVEFFFFCGTPRLAPAMEVHGAP